MKKDGIIWHIKHFNELSTIEFHNIIQLRESVFIVEQDCPYLDVDGKDMEAIHVFAINSNNKIIATTRLLAPGISYKSASIGRVCVSKDARGIDLGKILMQNSINYCLSNFGNNITISAQTYLLKFYIELGFKAIEKEYLEDNIPHFKMIYKSI